MMVRYAFLLGYSPLEQGCHPSFGFPFPLAYPGLKRSKGEKGLKMNSNQVTHPGGAYPGSTRERTTGSIAYFATMGY